MVKRASRCQSPFASVADIGGQHINVVPAGDQHIHTHGLFFGKLSMGAVKKCTNKYITSTKVALLVSQV